MASEGIELVTDTDSVKNCFKLEAGDDLMTATIRNCNPNGTDYIWYFSDAVKEDMPKNLVEKLESYDNEYKRYYNEYVSEIDEELLNNYNSLVDKYSSYNEDLQKITTPITGYASLMNAYYNTIDLSLYLKSGLMPSVEMSETNAVEQASLLTPSSLSPVAVANVNIVSLATANSAVLAMAKIIVKPTFKVEIKSSELYEDNGVKYWKGKFIVTNYSNEEDTAESNEVDNVELNDDLEAFTKQKIDKALNKENTDDLSISGLFEKEYDDFCAELKKYALNPLTSFHDACQACIDILIEQGIGNDSTWSDNEEGSEGNLHTNLYMPYYNKLMAIESETTIRENEINDILKLQTNIEECKVKIQDALDFEKYLGTELWLEFCAYRREDKYSNDNYISDGLNNAELFKNASEFFEVAENEIYKSAELQHSISTTLKNLLAIPKFKKLVDSFETGNWIRVRVDDRIYKLRLLEYDISYNNFDSISVEFSDVTKIKNGTTDIRNILSQASSMASSYNSVKRQANQGEKSNTVLSNWVENGLNATNTKIVATDNQNQVWDKNGILCREYDPITETYSNEQLKIINSTIAITDNNWETTKTAIGKYYYTDPISGELKTAYGVNGETIVGKLIIGEDLLLSNKGNNLEFGENGLIVKNDINTVSINPNDEESIINVKNRDKNIFSLDDDGNLVIIGRINALEGSNIDTGNITGLSDVALSGDYYDLENLPDLKPIATSGSYNDLKDIPTLSAVAKSGDYKDLSNTPTKLSDFENDGSFITNETNSLINYYNKTETDGLLELKANVDDLATVATSGSYKDLIDIEEFKNWVAEQIQLAINQQTNGS